MTNLGTPEWTAESGVWPRRCQTTRLSMVLAAAAGGESAGAARAGLYRAYFYPIYTLIAARRGRDAAEELTQAFFVERILDSKDLARFDPAKCRRFRNWLFTAVESFINNHSKAQRRQCRDVRKTLALDFEGAEAHFLSSPATEPERRYSRAWALCVLSNVISRARREYCAAASRVTNPCAETRFDAVKVFLPGPELEESAYQGLVVPLGMSTKLIKALVCRLRRRFGEQLREYLAELVASDEEVDSELQFLYQALQLPPSQYELHGIYRQ